MSSTASTTTSLPSLTVNYSIPSVFVMLALVNPCVNENPVVVNLPLPPGYASSVVVPNPATAPSLLPNETALFPPYPNIEQYFYTNYNQCDSISSTTSPFTYYYLYFTIQTANQYTFLMSSYSPTASNVVIGQGTAVLSFNQLDLYFESISGTTMRDPKANVGHVLFFRNNIERLGLAYFTGYDISLVLPGWFKLYPSTVCNYPCKGYYF